MRHGWIRCWSRTWWTLLCSSCYGETRIGTWCCSSLALGSGNRRCICCHVWIWKRMEVQPRLLLKMPKNWCCCLETPRCLNIWIRNWMWTSYSCQEVDDRIWSACSCLADDLHRSGLEVEQPQSEACWDDMPPPMWVVWCCTRCHLKTELRRLTGYAWLQRKLFFYRNKSDYGVWVLFLKSLRFGSASASLRLLLYDLKCRSSCSESEMTSSGCW